MKKNHPIVNNVFLWILIVILALFFISIFSINLNAKAEMYDSDMYSDMIFSQRVWESKSIFPDGWVFGNQIYVVATPVLASIFYGLTTNHTLSMGLASCLMSILIILSFDWMLKPITKSYLQRLLASISFITVILLFGGTHINVDGWQLLFTMCSYYACYAITAFLAFGCYIRSISKENSFPLVCLIISCVLSFATGIQSLRQTAIMTLPLIMVEFCMLVWRIATKKNIISPSLIISGSISACNILGLVAAKFLKYEQVEIFGNKTIVLPENIFEGILSAIKNILHNFIDLENILLVIIAAIICFAFFAFAVYLAIKSKSLSSIICLTLFGSSILVVFGLELLTSISIRSIYYFMVFPLFGIIVMLFSISSRKMIHVGIIICVILVSVYSLGARIPPALNSASDEINEKYVAVCDYLRDNNVNIIHSHWDFGEKIAIASDFEIEVCLFDHVDNEYHEVKYLCDPSIFERSTAPYTFVFKEEYEKDCAVKYAEERNSHLAELIHFTESDFYICTASENFMDMNK